MFLKKYILLFLVFATILLSGCFQSKIIVTTNKKLTLKTSVAEVRIQNNELIIEGNGLSSITTIKLVDAGVIQNFNVESATQNQLVAKGLSTVGIGVGKVFDLILSNANGASTFPVVFTLNNGSITGAQLNNMGATTGQVLRFNGTVWAPADLSSSQFYFGVWNANTDTPNLATTSPSAGDYYIVSVAGTYNSVSYNVGDWIIYNGTTWDQIHNSSTITNVFGRTGVVIGVKGDYNLTKMADVDLVTTPPTTNQVLKYNGTNWVPATVSAGGSGTVTSVTASTPLSVTNTTTTPAISIAQATTATDGYLSATHWNTFNNKEPAITSAATTKYFRGDKTFVTLDSSVVPENTNLYFTNARVLGVPLTGFDNALTGAVTATDSVLQAFGRIQNQITTLSGGGGNYLIKNAPDTLSGAITLTSVITASGAGDIIVNSVPLGVTSAVNKTYADTKQSAITIASTLNTGSITSNLQGGVVVNPYGGAAGNTGEVHFNELAANGANYIALKAPDSLAANIAFTLPAADGSAGQILKTNGAGILSWVNDNAGAGAFSGTINKAVATDGAGALTTSATSATELGYVAGVTSAIQTQLNAKQSATLSSANFLVGNGSNIATGVAMSGDATLANTGAITLNTVPITKGGTGATSQAAAQTALGILSAGLTATGDITGNIPLVGTGGIVANNLCAGASSGGGISCAVANSSAGLAGLITDETGTGSLVFATAPTITNPVITNILPGADFTLTQNAVVPFTSVNAGAVVNTLYLKAGAVGIATTAPNASSILDITSTTKGVLIPRMTTAQRTAIASPATGLQVYDTDLNAIHFYNGAAWQALGVAGAGVTSLSSANTDIGVAGTNTPVLTLNSGTGVGQILKFSVNAQLPALDGSLLTSLNPANLSAVVPVTKGGSGANITPVNGGIIYSNATTMAVTAAGSTGQILRSAGAAAPVWSTATYPATVGANNILLGSSANVVGEITTANSNILATNSSGVPSWNSPASIKTLLGYGTAANQNTGSLINTIPMFGANATVGSMCTYDLTLGFICNTPIPTSGNLSGLTAATATNTIDSLTFAQIWNWTTATTQSLMTMAANALTSGSILSLTTSNATVNSTNGLLNVANTGASTSGLLARFQSNSTAGSGMTVLANGNVGIGTAAPNANLQVAGSIATGFASKTANYTLTSTDSIVVGDSTSGAVTFTLPTAVGATGRMYTIKKIDSSTNAVNLATTSSQTIDGSTTRVLASQYGYMALVSDGANWLVTATSNACATSGSTTFTYTGSTQSFVIPCANFTVKMWGGGGGGGAALYSHSPTGGAGGFVSASMSGAVGDTLTVYVGGGGAGSSGGSGSRIAANGGGFGGGGGSTATGNGAGGGRSAIRNAGAVELVTAGGGGGGGTLFSATVTANGGAGGGLTASAGGQAGTMIAGGAGTPSAGGTGGSNSSDASSVGVAGSQYTGGQNTSGTFGTCGGGGGYYGGGTGATTYGTSGDGSGCGGGSSYYGGGGVTNGITTPGSGATAPNTGDASYSAGIAVGGTSGSAGGNGKVVISW